MAATSVNALLLEDIDEKIDYAAAYAGGKGAAVAIAVVAGPGTNCLLYLIARFAAPWWRTSTRPAVADLGFWFLLMQLANLYDYVPIRVAASYGDVRQWIRVTHMSPYVVYVVIGYLVLWAVVDLYCRVLPDALQSSRITTPTGRALVLIVATVVFFGYFAVPGLLEDGAVTLFITRTSLLAIPVVVLANWRRLVLLPQP